MPSLAELQLDFAGALTGRAGAGVAFPEDRFAIYRRTGIANYRNAMSATYSVVEQLVGGPFFRAAVDAYTLAHPSVSGDLNVYGGRFGDFLAMYALATRLPYLPDVARLEWAIDESSRAADVSRVPEAVLAALSLVPAERLPAMRLDLDPSCRMLASAWPVLQIWLFHQSNRAEGCAVDLQAGGETILLRRDATGVSMEAIARGDHAWLAALAAGETLGDAIDAAMASDSTFDLGAALRAHIATGTLVAVHAA